MENQITDLSKYQSIYFYLKMKGEISGDQIASKKINHRKSDSVSNIPKSEVDFSKTLVKFKNKQNSVEKVILNYNTNTIKKQNTIFKKSDQIIKEIKEKEASHQQLKENFGRYLF